MENTEPSCLWPKLLWLWFFSCFLRCIKPCMLISTAAVIKRICMIRSIVFLLPYVHYLLFYRFTAKNSTFPIPGRQYIHSNSEEIISIICSEIRRSKMHSLFLKYTLFYSFKKVRKNHINIAQFFKKPSHCDFLRL